VKLERTEIEGVLRVIPERFGDERGFFARTFCERTFREAGLEPPSAQSSVSFNARAGTLRGLHFQAAPHEEVKLVRCTRGRAFDVAVDLRPYSTTFRRWTSVVLSPDEHVALYVPRGCAHGFLTLEDATELVYQISPAFVAEAARGVRWDDPAFGIAWPGMPAVLSERDATYPDFVASRG
jgi:dTDP-4-dehydrorhamnose 3,5-epimerase